MITDELLARAAEAIFKKGGGTTSLLQRRLRLSYSVAAALIDRLEELGLIGEFTGHTARPILMTRQQWLETCARKGIDTTLPPEPPAQPMPEGEARLKEAAEAVFAEGYMTMSMLQRKLDIPFARAAYIACRLAELGFATLPDGAKRGALLMTRQQWQALCIEKGIQ